jgi:hypothetical protein
VKSLSARIIAEQKDPFLQQVRYALCDDIIFNFTWHAWSPLASVYGQIVEKLLGVGRSSKEQPTFPLCEALYKKYADDQSLKQLLDAFIQVICEYTIARVDGRDYTPKIGSCFIDKELMRLLAYGYLVDHKDHELLRSFLSAVFRRWRKIFAPESQWSQRILVHYCARQRQNDPKTIRNDRKAILSQLQTFGVIPGDKDLSAKRMEKLLNKIGQWISRDPRKPSGKKKLGFDELLLGPPFPKRVLHKQTTHKARRSRSSTKKRKN